MWRSLEHLIAARTGEAASTEIQRVMQGASIVLQRENARAALRRLPGLPAEGPLLAEP